MKWALKRTSEISPYDMVSQWSNMYTLMSTFELGLDSIWLLCFWESAQHQYYMLTPALAAPPPPPSPLGSDCHRKHKHSHRKQQKSKLFPCGEKEARLTGGGTGRRDDANEKMRQQQSAWDALGVMWLALKGFASCSTFHKTAVMFLAPGYCN